MGLFNAPNDIYWRNTVSQFQRSDSRLYYAKILDVEGDGNYKDNLTQTVSVELIGWGVVVRNCNVLAGMAGYNGEGQYKVLQKDDIVVGTAQEGQLNDFTITGTVRLNGDYKNFEGDGKQLKPGEAVEGELANQASLHPTRVTKLEGNFWMKAIHGLKSLYQSPSNAQAVEEILDKQGLPGVIKLQTKEGVDMTYAYGGIVHYTEGNYIVISGGSKINKCTKFLKQSKRHLEISNSLRSINQTRIGGLLEGKEDPLEIDIDSIDSQEKVVSLVEGDQRDFNTQLEKSNDSIGVANRVGTTGEGATIRDPLYRAKKHTELSILAAEQALNCNTTTASFQQQANLVAGQYGTFTNGGVAPTTDSTGQPTGRIGQLDPQNYTNRGNGQNPKPPVEFIQAANYSQGQMSGPNYRLFVHHTVGTMESGIALHRKKSTKASAHFFVGRDGRIVQMVKETNKAWHNGVSNANSFGIEVVATENEKGMTPVQENALIKLCRYLCERYNITTDKVFGHNAVKRTECPTWIWPTQTDVKNWAELYLKI